MTWVRGNTSTSSRFVACGAAALGVLFFGTATLVRAAESPVRFTVRSLGPRAGVESQAAKLSARRIDCDSGAGAQCEWKLEAPIPGVSELILPAGLYRFAVEGSSYFVAPRVEAISAPQADVELQAFLPAAVSGHLLVDRGVHLPAELELAARYLDMPALSSVASHCPVDKQGRWSCRIARGKADLRLHAPGFSSIFFWGVDLTGEPTLMEPRRLSPGSAVVGRVETSDRRPAAPAQVVLRYAGGNVASARSRARSELTSRRASLDEKGRFQFQAVEPGVYGLVVSKDGYAAATVAPLTVPRSGELDLQHAIRLARPIRFSIHLEPAADPYAAPWKLTLLEPTTNVDVWRKVAVRAVDGTGAATFSGLAPGRFQCWITLGEQEVFSTAEFEVTEEGEAVVVEVPLVSVLGSVTLGTEPLEADLSFSGKGVRRVTFASGPDGRFTGYLPRPGRYAVEVIAPERRLRREVKGIEVRADPVSGAAEIEIVLPSKKLAGWVSDDRGRRVPGALVAYVMESSRQMDSIEADRDGNFEFQALPAGRMLLWAEAAGARSETTSVTIPADAAGLDEIELVLRSRAIFRGRVTEMGDAVPGATVLGFARRSGDLSMSPDLPSTVTGLDGRFTLDLPGDVHAVDLVVLPPGRALAVRSASFPADGETLVELSPEAGALELGGLEEIDLDDPGTAVPVLLHRGVVLDHYLLTQWRRLNSGPAGAAAAATIPFLEPGTYFACALSPAEQFAVMAGLAAVRVEACSRVEVRSGEASQVRVPEPVSRRP